MWDYWAVFHNYFFQCEHSGLDGRFSVWGYNIETGLMEKFWWFGEETIFLIFDNGHSTAACQDYVNAMYVKDDELVIEVHRFKDNITGIITKEDEITNCLIKVRYEDGKFVSRDEELF